MDRPAALNVMAKLTGEYAIRIETGGDSLPDAVALDVGIEGLRDTVVELAVGFSDAEGEPLALETTTVVLAQGVTTTATVAVSSERLHDNMLGPSTVCADFVDLVCVTEEFSSVVAQDSFVATTAVTLDPAAMDFLDLTIGTQGSNPTNESVVTLAGRLSSGAETAEGVFLSLDEGTSWFEALPADGAFGSASEDWEASFLLPEGVWQIWARPETSVSGLLPKADWGDLTVIVDQTPPATAASVTATDTVSTVSLEATDTISGIAATYYRIDSSAATTYTAPFEVEDIETHEVVFWSVDRAGNTEALQTLGLGEQMRLDWGGPLPLPGEWDEFFESLEASGSVEPSVWPPTRYEAEDLDDVMSFEGFRDLRLDSEDCRDHRACVSCWPRKAPLCDARTGLAGIRVAWTLGTDWREEPPAADMTEWNEC